MRLLDRLRPQDRILEMVELAVEGRALVLPQRQDDGDRFVEHPQPLGDRRKRNPAHLEFRFGPSRSDTRQEPSAAQLIQRHQALRGDRRMTKQVAQHQMADANFLGRFHHDCGHHDMVEGPRLHIELPIRTLVHQMVGENDQVVAERLRGLRMRAILCGFKPAKLNSKFHWYLAKRSGFEPATLANRPALRTLNFAG